MRATDRGLPPAALTHFNPPSRRANVAPACDFRWVGIRRPAASPSPQPSSVRTDAVFFPPRKGWVPWVVALVEFLMHVMPIRLPHQAPRYGSSPRRAPRLLRALCGGNPEATALLAQDGPQHHAVFALWLDNSYHHGDRSAVLHIPALCTVNEDALTYEENSC